MCKVNHYDWSITYKKHSLRELFTKDLHTGMSGYVSVCWTILFKISQNRQHTALKFLCFVCPLGYLVCCLWAVRGDPSSVHLSVPPPTGHPGCAAEGNWTCRAQTQQPKNNLITLTLADLKDKAALWSTNAKQVKQKRGNCLLIDFFFKSVVGTWQSINKPT